MTTQHVLLVDGCAETETVLKTALRNRDVSVSRVRSGFDSVCPAEPAMLVVHDDIPAWPGVPRVVVGGADGDTGLFDYRELVATVDSLLKR